MDRCALLTINRVGISLTPFAISTSFSTGLVRGPMLPAMGNASVALTQDAVVMPRKGITGHDEWVVTEALATALVALEKLEPTQQSRQQMDDIRKLLAANCQPGTINLHLAQAKCRLNPHADRADIYREYGFEDWEV